MRDFKITDFDASDNEKVKFCASVCCPKTSDSFHRKDMVLPGSEIQIQSAGFEVIPVALVTGNPKKVL